MAYSTGDVGLSPCALIPLPVSFRTTWFCGAGRDEMPLHLQELLPHISMAMSSVIREPAPH